MVGSVIIASGIQSNFAKCVQGQHIPAILLFQGHIEAFSEFR